MQILLILEIDKSLIQYTLFYNNYYSLAISLKMSSSIVSEIKSFKSEIISSLIYPTILIILSFIALLFVSNFIIPQLVILNPNSMQNFNLIITILNILPIFILILV
ncbi:MAG: hypothetical protein RR577_04405, partial [Erysipelotrichales bacterium]